jgi:hypothetical protein
MAVKLKKRQSTVDLTEAIERRSLELEMKLLESQWDWLDNLVDKRAAYIDDATGEPWDPVGKMGYNHEQTEPWETEHDHRRIRIKSRQISRNPYAQGYLTNMRSFIVGKGHTYQVKIKAKYVAGYDARFEPHRRKLQNFIDQLLKANKWTRRQKEIRTRFERDGEVFIRIFPQGDGYARFRFVEPGQVTTPPEWQAEQSASYGIKTDPEDVETVEMYVVDGEEVPAHEVQHRKANVDVNCKRGLSSFFCIAHNLDRGKQLLTNMSQLLQTRAAIAMIRRHNKPSSNVRNFASSQAKISYTNPVTQEVIRGKPIRPGSVIDATKDTEYEFPSLNSSAADGTAVLGAELRAIASSKALAEYMIGSDASNANYASTMVAESPAVRFFESEQADTIEADLELIWAAIEYAIDANVLPRECSADNFEICVEPPQLVTRDPVATADANTKYVEKRIKSPQTIRGELGLDTTQEDKNFDEFDQAHLEGGALPMGDEPDLGAAGGGYIPPAEDVVAATEPEAALLNMAGGITGYLEIMAKLKEGVIHREQAINAMMVFFKRSREEAESMVGSE